LYRAQATLKRGRLCQIPGRVRDKSGMVGTGPGTESGRSLRDPRTGVGMDRPR
jgi:hypothetical protein